MTRLLLQFVIFFLIVLAIKPVSDWWWNEESYWYITCGEALHRANGSAAPRDKKEVGMWHMCVFEGIKKFDHIKWKEEYND